MYGYVGANPLVGVDHRGVEANVKLTHRGGGRKLGLPGGSSCIHTKTASERCWLDVAQIEQRPLFRRISRWGSVGEVALHEGSVNAILTALAQEAGGADFLEIKRQGGWRHDGAVHGYIEEARAFEEDAACSLLRRKLST